MRTIGGALAAFFCFSGFFCSEPGREAGILPPVTVSSASICRLDSLSLQPGIEVVWDFPASDSVSSFRLFTTFHPDSAPEFRLELPAGDERRARLPWPDTAREFELFFGVKAVWIEKTGERWESDSLPLTSLRIRPDLQIQGPGIGSRVDSSPVSIEVLCANDRGLQTRLWFSAGAEAGRSTFIDTCFPFDACGKTHFGFRLLSQALVLPPAAGEPPASGMNAPPGSSRPPSRLYRFCIVGSEGGEERQGSRTQSLACGHFRRFEE